MIKFTSLFIHSGIVFVFTLFFVFYSALLFARDVDPEGSPGAIEEGLDSIHGGLVESNLGSFPSGEAFAITESQITSVIDSWISLYRSYYSEVLKAEASSDPELLCGVLDRITNSFADRNEGHLRRLVDVLIRYGEGLDEGGRVVFAGRILEVLESFSERESGQRVVYQYLYRLTDEAGVYRPYRFDKSLGRLYQVESLLLTSWGLESDDD